METKDLLQSVFEKRLKCRAASPKLFCEKSFSATSSKFFLCFQLLQIGNVVGNTGQVEVDLISTLYSMQNLAGDLASFYSEYPGLDTATEAINSGAQAIINTLSEFEIVSSVLNQS